MDDQVLYGYGAKRGSQVHVVRDVGYQEYVSLCGRTPTFGFDRVVKDPGPKRTVCKRCTKHLQAGE